MAIDILPCGIEGYYHVYDNGAKVGQICKYLSGDVFFNGISPDDLEQILSKMKELQSEAK